MSAHSGADEEVLYKPFTVRALLTATARPCRVSEGRNLLESKIILLENGPVANSIRYQKDLTGEREGKEGEGKGSRVLYSCRQI